MRTLCDAYYEEHESHYRAFLDIIWTISTSETEASNLQLFQVTDLT